MKIDTCHLVLKTNKEVKQDAAKLRGYIGNTFKEYPILHNHYNESKLLYSYPLNIEKSYKYLQVRFSLN